MGESWGYRFVRWISILKKTVGFILKQPYEVGVPEVYEDRATCWVSDVCGPSRLTLYPFPSFSECQRGSWTLLNSGFWLGLVGPISRRQRVKWGHYSDIVTPVSLKSSDLVFLSSESPSSVDCPPPTSLSSQVHKWQSHLVSSSLGLVMVILCQLLWDSALPHVVFPYVLYFPQLGQESFFFFF